MYCFQSHSLQVTPGIVLVRCKSGPIGPNCPKQPHLRPPPVHPLKMAQEPHFGSTLDTQPCLELHCGGACAQFRLLPLLMGQNSQTTVLTHCLPCLSTDPITDPWLSPLCWDPVRWCLSDRSQPSMGSAQLLAQPLLLLLLLGCPSLKSGFRTHPLILVYGTVCGTFVQIHFKPVMLPVGKSCYLSEHSWDDNILPVNT